MSRMEFIRATCDRCAKVEEFPADDSTWKNVVIVEPRSIDADLCPDCFAGLCQWLDGSDAAELPTNTRDQLLRDLWNDGMPGPQIAERLGVSAARVYQLANSLGLPSRKRGRKPDLLANRVRPVGSEHRRHVTPHSGRSVVLQPDHPAILNSRTLFPSTVVSPEESPRLLVGGHNQRKIGKAVTKGAWAGMPIYCLTLEERKTCPKSCEVWRECYGNNMHMARRHAHGAALEAKLLEELAALQEQHPNGFVVRLHILGDFYSLTYVALWLDAMRRFPALRIFGFTAHSLDTTMGEAILRLNLEHVTRCRIRYSGSIEGGGMGAVVIDKPDDHPSAVVCPAQTGKTDCCATCALCWTMNKPVAFLRHGEAMAAAQEEAENA